MTATEAEILARLDFQPTCKGNCLHGRPIATAALIRNNPCGCRVAWPLCEHCTEWANRDIVPAIGTWICACCGQIWCGPSHAEVRPL